MKKLIALAVTLVSAGILIITIAARAGQPDHMDYVYLDPSFGSDGKVVTQVNGSEQNYANALVLQPDGKPVVAGYNLSTEAGENIALARYNPDGSLDESFGSGGVVSTDFMGGDDRANALAFQTDGKLVTAGCAQDGFQKMALFRYNPDGSLDKSWGGSTPWDGDGKVTTFFYDNYPSCANAVAIQPDGKIVAAGYTESENEDEMAIARFNPDGSLDTAFNGSGIYFSTSAYKAQGIVIQQDGKIVIVDGTEPIVVRLKPEGVLDDTFGKKGVFKADTWFWPYNIAIQPDGKLLIIGTAGWGGFWIERINPDGSVDESFGKAGSTTTKIGPPVGFDTPFALTVLPDQKIVVAGSSDTQPLGWPWQPPRVFAVVRYNPDGSLDTGFNGDGYVLTQFNVDSGNTDNIARSVVVQPDGKLVVAGYADLAGPDGNTIYQFALARYANQGFGLAVNVDRQLPDPGQVITYSVTLRNDGPQILTNARLTDILPGELTPAGTIQLEPPGAGITGTLPELVSGVTLDVGQEITITLPVSVSLDLGEMTTITNTVNMTSTEIPKLFSAAAMFTTNAPPNAHDDYVMMEKNTKQSINVLGNDSDPNGQTISLTEVGTPQHGAVVIDGSALLYTPETDFTGRDEFTYTVSDGSLSATATVTVDVLDKVWRTYLEFIPSSVK